MTAFETQLERIAQTPRLLVACDYDGVVAPIVSKPEDAVGDPDILKRLDELAALPQTDVAIVSGRSIESLRGFLGARPGWHLVGCHGAEWGDRRWDIAGEVSEQEMRHFLDGLRELAREFPGCQVETKPYGVAFHYRNTDDASGEAALAQAVALAEGRPGVHVRYGKKVVEISTSTSNKGDALTRLRHLTGASAAIFAGDDVTDEDAFAVLGDADIGISVGGLRRGAMFDVPDLPAIRDALQLLHERRASWRVIAHPRHIEHHSLLSDQRAAALVDESGSINWMCAPRFDSPPLFSMLLGGPHLDPCAIPQTAGQFRISSADSTEKPSQSYLKNTMVLVTRWPTFTVTDYLDCSNGRPFQRAGSSVLVRVVEGEGRVRADFAPRYDFGRITTTLALDPNGLMIEGHPDPAVLRSPGVSWTLTQDGTHVYACSEFELTPGNPVTFELRCGSGNLAPALTAEPVRRDQTGRFWSTWAGSLRLPKSTPEMVARSALTLKALTYGPTGAILAAATTSLPEWLGGARNWDYRYSWPRDSALAAAALARVGNTGAGMRLLDWLLGILDYVQSPERLRPIYTVTGHDLGPEAEISSVAGFAESRPVRVSNAASQQVQLDVFGPIVDLAVMLVKAGTSLSPEHWRLVEAMVLAVERRWRDPDNGIWEIRGPRRHYVHSKLMCWLAVERAIEFADLIRGQHPADWDRLVTVIREDVLEQGWDETLGGFRLAYDVSELDAASLLIGLYGLIPADDSRFARTVESVDSHLRVNSAVFRYRFDDGLPGREGGMLICMGWLIEAYAALGDRAKAENLFDRLLACAGHTGLLAEQVDAATGIALGNFPQVYSHLALINAAVALDRMSARD